MNQLILYNVLFGGQGIFDRDNTIYIYVKSIYINILLYTSL